MAAAGRRPGRRHNGLDAAGWRAIEDLDPRTSEDVLDVLATRGIAAYVQPAMDVDPITRSTTVPSRPSDRLFVDRRQVEGARQVLRSLFDEPARAGEPVPRQDEAPTRPDERGEAGSGGTEPGGTRPRESDPLDGTGAGDLDTAFAGIVAGFDLPARDPTAGWPAAEDLPPGDRPGARTDRPQPDRREPDGPSDTAGDPAPAGPLAEEPGPRPGPQDARHVTEAPLLDGLDTFGADLPDEPTERFVPPPPPPLPRLSRQTVLGALAVVGGLLLLLGRPQLLPLERSTTMLLGFAATLGGAVALILRLRPGTDPDEDPPTNDGAQV